MLEMIENKFAKFFALGAFIVTVLVITGGISDPVNVPKLLAISVLAFGLLPYLVYLGRLRLFQANSIPTYMALIFIGCALFAMVSSQAPLTQNLYGTTGRNTGFVALLSFAILFVVASNLTNSKNIKLFINAALLAGVVNVSYGFVDHFIQDPIPWNNNYGAFLGTFGNPNFAGAFMGLIVGISFVSLLANLKNMKMIIPYSILLIASAIVVVFTDTTQGILVSGLTAGVVFIIFLYKSPVRKIIAHTFMGLFLISGVTIVMGILQKGPLSAYLYKRSVSLRGVYWDTAIQVGHTHPFTGVGLDAFGDWYRTSRSLKAATWLPGPETISNSAHNLFLDMYANGGVPLLVSYSSIAFLGFFSIYKILKQINKFDPIAVTLVATFIGFQAQALISIAQIGIAIWGWILAGLLHSYAKILGNRSESELLKSNKIKKISKDSPVGVFVFISAAIGFLIAIPPYSADAKYNSAVNSQDLKKIEAVLQPSYFNPISSQRFAMAAYLLEQNNFNELSHKYALKGVEYNPHFYEAWKLLYVLKNSTNEERKMALAKMKDLDPLNPNLEKLK